MRIGIDIRHAQGTRLPTGCPADIAAFIVHMLAWQRARRGGSDEIVFIVEPHGLVPPFAPMQSTEAGEPTVEWVTAPESMYVHADARRTATAVNSDFNVFLAALRLDVLHLFGALDRAVLLPAHIVACPYIASVNGLTPHMNGTTDFAWYVERLGLLMRAGCVIASSEAVKRDIADVLGIPDAQLWVARSSQASLYAEAYARVSNITRPPGQRSLRVAMWTPLRPTRSGIADYVEEFLPSLTGDQMPGAAPVPPAMIDLYTLDEPESDDVRDRCAVLHASSFEAIHRHRPYDAIIYQIGSTPEHHRYICEQSIKHPGLLVMHDPNIHSYALARLGSGNLPAYLQAVRDELGDDMVAYVRQVMDDGTFTEKVVYEYNMDGWLLRHSRGAIYHSYFAMQDARQRRPEVPSFYIPLYAVEPARPNDEQRRLILSRRGWPADSVIIGAFGIMAPSKRVSVLLRAFKQLAQRYPQVVLTLVGNTAYYDVAKEVEQLDLDRERVCVTGEVTMDDFLAYMQAADIGVNLRYPSLGESSAIISRLIGMGKPIITSDIPQFGELPDEFCWKVPVGEHEVDVLMAYLNELTWDRDLRQEMGWAALSYARESMSPSLAAQGYLRIAEHVFCGGPEPHLEEHIPVQYRRRAELTVQDRRMRHQKRTHR